LHLAKATDQVKIGAIAGDEANASEIAITGNSRPEEISLTALELTWRLCSH
jgi:hypothetical protein